MASASPKVYSSRAGSPSSRAMPTNVNLYARFRPLTLKETASPNLQLLMPTTVRYDQAGTPNSHGTPRSGTPRSRRRGSSSTPTVARRTAGGSQLFRHHHIFGPEDSTAKVYKVVEPMVDSLFNGYNCSFMSYGISGSGKTYTIFGTPSTPGILPLTIGQILEQMDQKEQDCSWDSKLTVSVVQIYLEKVLDLLADDELDPNTNPGLPLRQTVDDEVYVEGVRWRKVKSLNQAMRLITEGNTHRVTASTGMNNVSSRSHVVCCLRLEQVNTDTQEVLTSKFNLVDLAGSEMVRNTGAQGLVLKQAGHVNKSLSSLSNVISALSSRKSFIPYRDSKLTRLLSFALGGNSKTTIMLNCTQSDQHVQETVATLQFGKRAMDMPNDPRVNKKQLGEDYKALWEALQVRVKEHETTIESLERENARLNTILAEKETKSSTSGEEEEEEDVEAQSKSRSFVDLHRGIKHFRKSLGGFKKEDKDELAEISKQRRDISTDEDEVEMDTMLDPENDEEESDSDSMLSILTHHLTLPPVTRPNSVVGSPIQLRSALRSTTATTDPEIKYVERQVEVPVEVPVEQQGKEEEEDSTTLKVSDTDDPLNTAVLITGAVVAVLSLVAVLLAHLWLKLPMHPALYGALAAMAVGAFLLGWSLPAV